MVKTIEEALKNFTLKCLQSGLEKQYCIIVHFNKRVYYEFSKENPNQEQKKLLLNNIKNKILEYENDVKI